MQYTLEVKHIPSFHKARPVDSQLTFHDGNGTPSRYIGVEIECDGFHCPNSYNPFENHSLTGLPKEVREMRDLVIKWGGGFQHDRDFEIQTAPARGEPFRRQIEDICDALEKAKTFQDGLRSGLHIHIDARDLTDAQLRKVILAYGVIEEVVARAVPYKRAANYYCKPLGEYAFSGLVKIPRGQIKYRVDKKCNLSVGGVAQRYLAMNLNAFLKHKTLEVRTHEATMDAKEIIGWSTFWADFIDNAKSMSTLDIMDLKNAKTRIKHFVSEDSLEYIKKRRKKFSGEWSSRFGEWQRYRTRSGDELIALYDPKATPR